MKLTDIKTTEEIAEVCKGWQLRKDRLFEIFENENETENRKSKAYKLGITMSIRLMKIYATAISAARPKFAKGGIIENNLKII